MERTTTILITGVGSGVAQSVIKALKYANRQYGRKYYLIGTDASWKAAGLFVLEKGFLLPYCHRPEYLPRLIEVCNKSNVDFIIPGTDPEVKALCAAKEKIEVESSAHLVVNPPRTVEVGYDKYKTSLFLQEHRFPYPKTVCLKDPGEDLGELDFPLIVKPRFGSGSVGMSLITNCRMLENHLASFEMEMIAQEYIEAKGDEYTCGLAFDWEGTLFGTIIMRRDLKKGFTQFAQVVGQKQVQRQIHEIGKVLEGRGSYNVQGRLIDGKYVVFEINPRFSGTTAFRAVAGMNEPDMYIQHFLYGARPESTAIKPLCMMRYLNECYLDPGSFNRTEDGAIDSKGFQVNYF